MTKTEQRLLHSDKCKVEQVEFQSGRGLEKRYVVSMSLCPGELLALHTSLAGTSSIVAPVSKDVLAFLNNALERAGIKTYGW